MILKHATTLTIFLILIFRSPLLISQENGKPFGLAVSGFVKNDVFFDTRQTVAAREGHFLLWPAPENLDPEGNDVNEKFNYNILAIQSRLSFSITGPDAFGAKTSGLIEGDFFAQANDNINLFRLRHAFLKLKWPGTELLAGQFWNPLFVTDCFPGTVSFNTGTPIQPFARNPQLLLTHNTGNLRIIAAALAQRDYVSAGGSSTLRNAGIPDLHLQFHVRSNPSETSQFVAGVGTAFKQLVPEIETSTGYKTSESVSGISFIGFFKLVTPSFTFKIEDVYGQNLYDVLSLSSYAVTEVTDVIRQYREYTPTRNNAFWAEIHTNGDSFQAGIFGGFNKNLGASEDVVSVAGSRSNIDHVMRISPRIIFISEKTRFGAELEYTGAAFGSLNDKAEVIEATYVGNARLLLSCIYSF